MTDMIDKQIATLDKLKMDIISIIEDSGNAKELTDRFMSLSRTVDEDDYEIIQTLILMQDISNTNHKNFKNVAIQTLTILIDSKISSYRDIKLLNERITVLEKAQGTQVKIPMLGKISTKDLMYFIIAMFILIFTAYSLNPQATERTAKFVGGKVTKKLKEELDISIKDNQ